VDKTSATDNFVQQTLPLARLAITVSAFSVALRLVLIGTSTLLTDEAYYWNYAKHLDLGYLDHPPLSAWLIALGQLLFGQNEFSVRISSVICSLVSLSFILKLGELQFGKSQRPLLALIFLSMPYLLGEGLFMSPDAPLLACWSAVLCLCYGLSLESPRPGLLVRWLALGAAFGLGMLSKYTIVLPGLGLVLLFAFDRQLRGWFLRFEPYLAILTALIIFSPVIYWNAKHDWASFAFQSTKRFESKTEFSLHIYLFYLFILCTPAGFFTALRWFAQPTRPDPKIRRFVLFFSALPISFFMLYSLRHEPKIVWAGPAFLALLPIFANFLSAEKSQLGRLDRAIQRAWLPFIFLSLVGFFGFVLYTGLGIPMTRYSARMNKTVGWESLAKHVYLKAIKHNASHPIIIGMDKHFTAAELSFYCDKEAKRSAGSQLDVTGRAIFGMEALMWRYWRPNRDLRGSDAILVSRSKDDLEVPELSEAFTSLGEIERFESEHNEKPAGVYYLRIGSGLKVQ